ncbi:AHH domain-containing protein [Pelagerythrobacter marinus]|uniref:AHH domain-containing protein n=1 Tax=Pelagerythrobacter marinus TaxID=538382 RepID=UPI00301C5F7F
MAATGRQRRGLRRRPIPFASVNRKGAPGYDAALQRHHLLPRQLRRLAWFAPLLDELGGARIGLEDFRRNGMLLPAREAAALRLALPLHRGPHRAYNELVAQRVGQIERRWSRARASGAERAAAEALMRLELLQRALRRRLLDGRRRLVLNRRDPVGAGYDFAVMDALAETLWRASDPQTVLAESASFAA